MLPLGTPTESFPLASVMPVCKHPVATLGLSGNRHPYAYAQKNVGAKVFPVFAWFSRTIKTKSAVTFLTSKSAFSVISFGRSRTIYVRADYILGAIGCTYACRSPPRTKPRFASLVPNLSADRQRGHNP